MKYNYLLLMPTAVTLNKTSWNILQVLLQYVYRRSYHLVYYKGLIYINDEAESSFIDRFPKLIANSNFIPVKMYFYFS